MATSQVLCSGDKPNNAVIIGPPSQGGLPLHLFTRMPCIFHTEYQHQQVKKYKCKKGMDATSCRKILSATKHCTTSQRRTIQYHYFLPAEKHHTRHVSSRPGLVASLVVEDVAPVIVTIPHAISLCSALAIWAFPTSSTTRLPTRLPIQEENTGQCLERVRASHG